MEEITMQVIEEKVTITVLAIYVIVIIQTKIRKQNKIHQYSQRSHFFVDNKNLGNLLSHKNIDKK